MSMDLHGAGANFKRDVMADVRELVAKMLGSIGATVAVQDDGTVESDQHRILNFRGPGVAVSDDPAMRRTNIFIPGAVVLSTTETFVSNTAAKVHNVSPVSDDAETDFPGWRLSGFSDGSWANAVVAASAGTAATPPTGSSAIWDTATRPNTDVAQKLLLRSSYSLADLTISSATLEAAFDGLGYIYVNGTLIGSAGVLGGTNADVSGSTGALTVSPSLLTQGVVNVVAVQMQSSAYTAAHNRFAAWKLIVNYSASAGGRPYLNIQDRKTAGTDGGTFTSGADRTRVLNTVVSDAGSLTSLASNQFTLPVGTYECHIRCPGYAVDRHVAWLYNVTDSATLVQGENGFSANSANGYSPAVIRGRFTIAGTKTLEVRHRCQTTVTTNGFGISNNGTFTVPYEVYTNVEIWQDS